MAGRRTSPDPLGRRALNRALLARQLLLRRQDLGPAEAITRLVGLQAQNPVAPYLALWSRLAGFDADEVSAGLLDRRLVRMIVMRGTIHLLTVEDAAGLRALTQPVMDAALRTTKQYVAGRGGADPRDIATAARDHLQRHGAATTTELGAALQPAFPGSEVPALGFVARAALPLVQVPPRGTWGGRGRPRCDAFEHWTGRELGGMNLRTLVLRFLAAFGPASVADAQAWSGLTRLGEVVDSLGDRVRPFRGPDGTPLWDVPDAPRPDPDVTAPVRLLPDFDNVLLSHADRTRVIAAEHRQAYVSPNGQVPGTVLIDGFARAQWRTVRGRAGVRIDITPLSRLPVRGADTAQREALRLLRFTDPDADAEVRLLDPIS